MTTFVKFKYHETLRTKLFNYSNMTVTIRTTLKLNTNIEVTQETHSLVIMSTYHCFPKYTVSKKLVTYQKV